MNAEQFYQLSTQEIAKLVREAGVNTCVFPVNGTRRWFMLEWEARQQRGEDPTTAYLDMMVEGHIDQYRRFFDHGIHTLLAPVFGPDLIDRGEEYTHMALDGLALLATNPEFLAFYDEYQVHVGFYGDYRKILANSRFEYLIEIFDDVAARTASYRQHRLFYGVFAHDAAETIAELSVRYHAEHNRLPDKRTLVELYYGEYVEPVNFFIGFDKFCVFDMPLVATGNEDLYFTVSPSLYFSEQQLREILFDHLYTRRAEDADYLALSPEAQAEMRNFYQVNRWKTMGVGARHPTGEFWYPLPQVELHADLSTTQD